MALIRNAQAQFAAKEAVVLDLGDLKRQGEALQASATKRAESIISDAHIRRDELIADAAEDGRRQGFAIGYEEGLQQGIEEGRDSAMKATKDIVDTISAEWDKEIQAFETQRDQILVGSRLDVLRLSMRLAEKVVKRAISVDETIVEEQLAAILSLLSRRTRLVVSVHPDDAAVIREVMPALTARFAAASHVEIMTDESMTRGGVVARTQSGAEVDASIETQLERLALTILPEGDA